jgi:hypothetical protein
MVNPIGCRKGQTSTYTYAQLHKKIPSPFVHYSCQSDEDLVSIVFHYLLAIRSFVHCRHSFFRFRHFISKNFHIFFFFFSLPITICSSSECYRWCEIDIIDIQMFIVVLWLFNLYYSVYYTLWDNATFLLFDQISNQIRECKKFSKFFVIIYMYRKIERTNASNQLYICTHSFIE